MGFFFLFFPRASFSVGDQKTLSSTWFGWSPNGNKKNQEETQWIQKYWEYHIIKSRPAEELCSSCSGRPGAPTGSSGGSHWFAAVLSCCCCNNNLSHNEAACGWFTAAQRSARLVTARCLLSYRLDVFAPLCPRWIMGRRLGPASRRRAVNKEESRTSSGKKKTHNQEVTSHLLRCKMEIFSVSFDRVIN